MQTTLNKIRDHSPCVEGWSKLLSFLGKTKADNEPLPILTILGSNGLDDALWCLRAVDDHDREIRLFAVWCARQVQHLMTDQRSIDALDVSERFANGQATSGELVAARAAARAAATSDAATSDAAWAAWNAARAAAWAATSDAAWAARDARDARDAASDAASDAARDARDAQKAKLIEICNNVGA